MSGVITPIKVASAGVNVPNNLVPPAKVLVLGCIDPRFASQLEWFLTHQAGIFGQYDLFVLAGASLGVNQAQSYRELPGAGGESATDGKNYNNGLDILNNWDSNFYAHLSIAMRIHDITDVWIFDHLDCGAYKLIKFGDLTETDEDILEHSVEIERLAGNISGYEENQGVEEALGDLPIPFIQLNIKGFVMDLSGNIFKVYDDGKSNNGGGYDISSSSSSSSDNVWVIPVILSALVLLFIYFKFFMTPKL